MFGPKDGLLDVTTELENSVTAIDPRNVKIIAKIPTGHPESHMLAITHNGATQLNEGRPGRKIPYCLDDARRDLQAWLGLAMTLWLVRAIAVLLSGPPQGGSRLLLGEIATLVSSIIGTVYLGPLLLWSLNRLNFWLLLIVILLIQDYRYDEPPLFGRLVGAVNGVRHRQRAMAIEAMPVPEAD